MSDRTKKPKPFRYPREVDADELDALEAKAARCLTKQEAQVLLPFADKVALGPFRGGALIEKLTQIAGGTE